MTSSSNSAAQLRVAGESTNEPSMEEILASIRRIIADDQFVPLAPANNQQPPRVQLAREPEPVSTFAPPVAAPAAEIPESPAVEEEFRQLEEWLKAASAPLNEAPPVSIGAPPPAAADLGIPAPENDASEDEGAVFERAISAVARPPEKQEAGAFVADENFAELRPAFAPAVQEPSLAEAAIHAQSAAEGPLPACDDLDTPLAPPPAAEAFSASSAGPSEPLLSPTAGLSVESSFQALARTMFMQNTGMVEDAIRDMLRPMLKQWLDDNLPVMVERLVRAEIERVARGPR